MSPSWFEAIQDLLITLAASVTALGILFLGIKRVYTFARKMDDFTDAWNGRDGNVGVLEQLEEMRAELSINSGSSLKDAVIRIETLLKQHLEDGKTT